MKWGRRTAGLGRGKGGREAEAREAGREDTAGRREINAWKAVWTSPSSNLDCIADTTDPGPTGSFLYVTPQVRRLSYPWSGYLFIRTWRLPHRKAARWPRLMTSTRDKIVHLRIKPLSVMVFPRRRSCRGCRTETSGMAIRLKKGLGYRNEVK